LAHEQAPLSSDTIDSVLRHQEVGRAKDLSAPPCINLSCHPAFLPVFSFVCLRIVFSFVGGGYFTNTVPCFYHILLVFMVHFTVLCF